jgi:hypothetical protein
MQFALTEINKLSVSLFILILPNHVIVYAFADLRLVYKW